MLRKAGVLLSWLPVCVGWSLALVWWWLLLLFLLLLLWWFWWWWWAVLYAPREQRARVERLCCRAVSSCQQKVNGPEILNKYVGQSEENIRELFKDAEEDQVRVPPRGIPAFRRRSPAFRNSCRSRGWFAKHTRHGVDTHATTGLLAQLLNEGAGDL